ncbi:protein CURVATURE THYLAKOID 1D, chloroplastic-like [Impatiens glandulifera]|uniref:protein CURVATURE THYLAKOID 1D, chloroplastic-like n=1 Tax=Impatiens glandulifera TaxID=253017 RepID=UPI001FB19EA5|nr:protein CURVATURE THYLAKOID 1D, chloroplastic-like [Impatiens glandulifera]
MELSTSITISALPSFTFNRPFLTRKTSLPFKLSSFSRTNQGLLYRTNLTVRSTYEEEIPTDSNSTNYVADFGKIKIADDEQESLSDDSPTELIKENIKMEDDQPVQHESSVSDDSPAGFPKEDSPLDGQMQTLEFIDKLDIKWDSDSSIYSSLLLGGGALFGLWLATAVVGAVDSIPLLPKFLEVVGLGYTLWFGTRYLIFKENRKELASKIEEIKKYVI